MEFIKPGRPIQNGFFERSIAKAGVLDMYLFQRLSEVRETTDKWVQGYNEKWPYDALGTLTPKEFRFIRPKF